MSQIKTELNGAHLLIKLTGRFTFSIYKDFSAAYKDLPEKPTAVDVDLGAVEYIDSAALGMLLSMRNYVGPTAKLRLLNASDAVRKILEIARFDKTFLFA